MGNIVLLDDLTINKIAAGEVIERPASVVKEMVENSIDAGAKNITVEIRNGGISFIKISDDGKGIQSDDLEIAFERHATSKIRSADDLNTITSMGFRGEALASIAAISNVEVVSKTASEQIGYKVVVEAGEILDKQEVGCKNGTTMIVKNLFFNTPVRYKFLKKDFTESGYIEDVITRIALVNPDIAIKLINTGKTVIQTTGNGKLKDVVYNIYGKDVAQNIIETSYDYENIKVTGVVGKPSIARSNRNYQIFFVNKRYVKDKTLSYALEQAFKGIIPIGKFGFAILNIEIDPSKVDVNVHPAKLEVRFEEENKVFQSVYHTVKEALLKGEENQVTEQFPIEKINNEPKILTVEPQKNINIIEDIYNKKNGLTQEVFVEKQNEEIKNEEIKNEEIKEVFPKKENDKIKEEIIQEDKNIENENSVYESDVLKELIAIKEKITNDVNKLNDTNQEYKYTINNKEETEEKNDEKEEIQEIQEKNSEKEQLEEKEEIKEQNDYKEKIEEKNDNKEEIKENDEKSLDFAAMFEKTFGRLPIQDIEKKQDKQNAVDIINNNVSLFKNNEEYRKPFYKLIGIAFNEYIIVEIEKEMYVIDEKSVHERIMYERLKKNYYNNNVKDSQILLLPDIINLTQKQMDITRENMDLFKKAGFSIEEFGENTIKINGVPDVCLHTNTKDLLFEILKEINTVARNAKQEKEEKFLWTVASKTALTKKQILNEKEAESLIDELLQYINPFTCSNGRNIAIKFSKYDIERKFSRK